MKTQQGGRNGGRGTILVGRALTTRVRELLARAREEGVGDPAAIGEERGAMLLRAARTACSRALRDRALDEASLAQLRERHEEILLELMKGYPASWVLDRVLARQGKSVCSGADETGAIGRMTPADGTRPSHQDAPAADDALDALVPLERRTVRFALGELRALRSSAGSATRPRVEPLGLRPFGMPPAPPPRDPWWNNADRDALLARLGDEPPEGVGVIYEVRAAHPDDARVLLAEADTRKKSAERTSAKTPDAVRTPKRNKNAKAVERGERSPGYEVALLVRRASDLKRAFLATLGHPDAAPDDYGLRFATWTAGLPDTLEITFEATLWSPLLTRQQLVRLTDRAWRVRRPIWDSRKPPEPRKAENGSVPREAAPPVDPDAARAADVVIETAPGATVPKAA